MWRPSQLLPGALGNLIATKVEIRNVGPVPAVITSVAAGYSKPAAEQRNPPIKRVAVFPAEVHIADFSIRWEGNPPYFDPRLTITIVVNYTRLAKNSTEKYFTEHLYSVDFTTPGDLTTICWVPVSTEGA